MGIQQAFFLQGYRLLYLALQPNNPKNITLYEDLLIGRFNYSHWNYFTSDFMNFAYPVSMYLRGSLYIYHQFSE
jgi:hypothetical protein